MAINASPLSDDGVYLLTAKGERELHGTGTSLSPAEIELLVRTDGVASIAEIKASVRSLPPSAVDEKLRGLVNLGLIASATDRQKFSASDLTAFFTEQPRHQPSALALDKAREDTPAGLSNLRKNGYYVRIARRAAARRELPKGTHLPVVVVEDEPTLAKFLRQYLAFEGFEVTLASNRAEVIEAFRQTRAPALVLLDVVLPDADGFDILLKMREHPTLKSVPVIMMTAKATREAVLKGLACGANGYVTKPFEADALVQAVKTVLGLQG